MIRLMLIFIGLFTLGTAFAQDAPPYRVQVDEDSVYVRAAPSVTAESIASLFRNEWVEVVSRNLDGSWFEVRRPGRMTNLGWVYNRTLEWDFRPELLPLGDNTTGLIGETPVAGRPPIGVYLLEGASMRASPSRRAPLITTVPPLVTVPVLARNQTATWLLVNYLGYEGWIIVFATRDRDDLMSLPEAPGLPPPDEPTVVIIPPEVQQAQVDRLRAFVLERRALASDLESFWWAVFKGEVMPCSPPPSVAQYSYSPRDIQELPELQRYLPRLSEAVDRLNAAIAPINQCGVITPSVVGDARDDAINARIIFDATLDVLENLEEFVIPQSR